MATLTIIQVTTTMVLYIGLTCALPFWLLNRKLLGFRLCEKLLLSYIFGNFYIINLVFVLQLLHISNRLTLILGAFIPLLMVKGKWEEWHPVSRLKELLGTLKKVVFKEMGLKSVLRNTLKWIGQKILWFVKKCLRVMRRNPLDVVLFLGFTGVVLYMYGKNLVNTFGYCTSDVPVHNYWINYLSRGKIFVAGVYPMGFHAMIYYLHAVFGLPTYVLLRVFCLVQTLCIHWALLLVMKALLRARYMAYAAAGFYVCAGIFSGNTYLRFFNSLPQEFGMIFILPSIYFGFAYFRYRKQELAEKKRTALAEVREETREETQEKVQNRRRFAIEAFHRRKKKKRKRNAIRPLTLSVWCLFGFAMSFGLTLVGHFYDTIIAAIFCVAMAMAFFFRFFNKHYFGWVLLTVFVSVLIAVLPMGIAFVTGTPLEGSLNWAMGVISDSTEEEETEEQAADGQAAAGQGQTQTGQEEAGSLQEQAGQEQSGQGADSQSSSKTTAGGSGNLQAEESAQAVLEVQKPSLKERLLGAADTIDYVIRQYVFSQNNKPIRYSIYLCIALLGVLSLLFFMIRQPDYGAQLLSVSLYMAMLSILIAASKFGLPQLMDSTRVSIFFAYGIPLLWGFAADALLYLLFGWTRRAWVLNLASLAVIGAAAGLIFQQQILRKPRVITALETNGAITCLTNIIRENDNWTWTILSPNDELRMGEDYGYHYETIDFLRKLEFAGQYADMTIPTKYVYFYVEKIPLDYYGTYEGSGQSVSEAGAEKPLPGGSGLPLYYTENRWILMSRMYYWAEAFRKQYPHEMQVYYESDNFICYRLEQNPEKLIDLGIDYGYNNVAAATE